MRTAIAIAALGFTACASAPPKSQELQNFEQLKTRDAYSAAQTRAPELVLESNKLFAKSRKEWESNDPEESRRDAIMGAIKLSTAYALVEQDQARAKVQTTQSELAKAQEEYSRLAKDLAAANEQIALLQKLAASNEQQQKLSQELTQEQGRAQATDKVKAAEFALKNAEGVDAARNAPTEYQAATELLERARAETRAGSFIAAATSADQAKAKAEQAHAVAQPLFQQGQQVTADKTRTEALTRDASVLSGVGVKMDRRGEMQRLRMVLAGLFTGRSTVLPANRDDVLDGVAGLLKKYPNYAVQVIGHTDSRGKHDELVALSLARAQSVYSALITRGVDPKRALVSGQGPDDPIVAGKSTAARAQNNRIEIIILYK